MTQNRWYNLKSIESIKYLINLEELRIMNSGLEELKADIFKNNQKLVKLDVPKNNLNKLYPNTLRHLNHLNFINIGQNPIEKIPSQFFARARNLKIIRFTVYIQKTVRSQLLLSAFPNWLKLVYGGPYEPSKDLREGWTDAAIMLCKLNKSL